MTGNQLSTRSNSNLQEAMAEPSSSGAGCPGGGPLCSRARDRQWTSDRSRFSKKRCLTSASGCFPVPFSCRSILVAIRNRSRHYMFMRCHLQVSRMHCSRSSHGAMQWRCRNGAVEVIPSDEGHGHPGQVLSKSLPRSCNKPFQLTMDAGGRIMPSFVAFTQEGKEAGSHHVSA